MADAKIYTKGNRKEIIRHKRNEQKDFQFIKTNTIFQVVATKTI